MTGRASSASLLLALLVVGCGGSSRPAVLDGTYRATVTPADLAGVDAPGEGNQDSGTWTLALKGSRFALTRENDQACTWAYGALALARAQMRLTIIDAGGFTPGPAAEPGDRYRLTWSRYRDVLTLHASTNSLAARPWRRIAATPSVMHLSPHCRPPRAALEPTGAERAVPSAGAHIDFVGDLVKTGPATWSGSGSSPGLGRGRLDLYGRVPFLRFSSRAPLGFAMRFSAGVLRGCAVVQTVPRPNDRYLWESSSGQVTAAPRRLRGYLGLPVGISGVTRRADRLARMHGSLNSQTSSPSVPGDLC
jgi:hypothetical protein